MKEFLENHLFKYQWLFAITLIVLHIESKYNRKIVIKIVSLIFADITYLTFINKLLTGIIALSISFSILKYLLILLTLSELDEQPCFIDLSMMFPVIYWLVLLKYAVIIFTETVTKQTFWSCLTDGLHKFYLSVIVILVALIILVNLIRYIKRKNRL